MSETIRPRSLIIGMWHYLVDRYQICLNYVPGVKNGPASGVTCFTEAYIGINMEKIFLSETIRPSSQGARFLKIDLAQLASQKRLDFRNS